MAKRLNEQENLIVGWRRRGTITSAGMWLHSAAPSCGGGVLRAKGAGDVARRDARLKYCCRVSPEVAYFTCVVHYGVEKGASDSTARQ